MNQHIPTDPKALLKACQTYADLVKIYPNNETYLQHYADLLIASEKPATALEVLQALYQKLRQQAPHKAQALALLYPQLGHIQQNDVEATRHHDIYHALTEAVGSIWIRLHQKKIHAGQHLYTLGEHGDSLSLLIRGELAIYIQSQHGKYILLNLLEKEDFVGETCLLTPGKRAAHVVANQDCCVVHLPRKKLLSWLSEHPNIETKLEQISSNRTVLCSLSSNSILQNIPINLRQYLASQAVLHYYQKDNRIHSAGEAFLGVDLIIQGQACYIQKSPHQNTQLEKLAAGDLMGDIAAVCKATHPADLIASSKLTIAHIPMQCFKTVVAAYPPLKEALFQHAESQRIAIMSMVKKT
ncbi:MAG: cyclic nucleotide-binding domain-containing protein [Mariprofundaceae bacterium]